MKLKIAAALAPTALALAWGAVPAQGAVPATSTHYHSQAQINTTLNIGGLGDLTSNCLYQADTGHFVTQEMWDEGAGPNPAYWVEAGQVSGNDPIGNHTYYRREWFWADQRPNGGGYHEHFTGAAGSGTYKLELEYLGGSRWGINEGGITGTSTGQPENITANGAVAVGTEYTAAGPAGIQDQGNIHNLQYKDASTSQWYAWSDFGAVSQHAWVSISYHSSNSEADWNVPCTNTQSWRPAVTRVSRRQPAAAGQAIPAAAQRQLRTVEQATVAQDGDAHPAQSLVVATTEASGSRDATPGDRVTTNLRRVVYLVVMKGNFTVRTMSPAKRGTVHGHYLSFTLNPQTLQAIDAGVSNQPPPTALSKLGAVSSLLTP